MSNKQIIIGVCIVVVLVLGVAVISNAKDKQNLVNDSAFQSNIDKAIDSFTIGNHWGWLFTDYFLRYGGGDAGMRKMMERIYEEAKKGGVMPMKTISEYNYARMLPQIQKAATEHNKPGFDFGGLLLKIAPIALAL